MYRQSDIPRQLGCHSNVKKHSPLNTFRSFFRYFTPFMNNPSVLFYFNPLYPLYTSTIPPVSLNNTFWLTVTVLSTDRWGNHYVNDKGDRQRRYYTQLERIILFYRIKKRGENIFIGRRKKNWNIARLFFPRDLFK